VARYGPRYLKKTDRAWDEWHKELAPSVELHATWYGKGGRSRISWEDYVATYRKEMASKKDQIEALASRLVAGETITLLCHCRDVSRCHRTILQGMIEEAAERLKQRSPASGSI
jgi:uncharacterized protein YeaO (DUF488 family)